MANSLILRVLLAGGGTGGHIYPLVIIKEKIQEYCEEHDINLDARYFGNPGTFETYLNNHGIKVIRVASSKMRRYFSLLNILDFFKFFWGLFSAIIKMFWFMPDVVFSKGGPGALSVIYAARFYRVPVVIHESDATAGITSRASAKHAEIIEVAFEEAIKDFPSDRQIRVVGGLVRDSLTIDESKATSRLAMGMPTGKPVILILGGSQGAQSLNYFVLENSEELLKNFAIIHQVGQGNYLQFKAEYDFMSRNHTDDLHANYRMHPYLDDNEMATALNAADVVVCRSGSQIFELAALGKPSILIPLPSSANDHQRENAYAYSKSGAAVVIEEENLLSGVFITQVKKIVGDEKMLERMSQSARTFYRATAAEMVAKDVIEASRIVRYYANQLAS
ncbi:MAG: UDP-N-acetylglucosamine--N-acetylmuramyl-(pentapeptide) pyrophosphoryl-undecaprenol N-acetylglucosamine transferase [bacterium]|nr:UDP-N-acetylglucosamine--N-acetylmuramyl-(pentapeptide) pyrophosphoryl-undecaprenol N-acetylglucosamine transferase [bacterium]